MMLLMQMLYKIEMMIIGMKNVCFKQLHISIEWQKYIFLEQ